MQSPLHRRVLSTIREHDLVRGGDRIAVAVSGGADSVALLLVLTELQAAGVLPGEVVGLIHVNHQLRGAESDRDEAFCVALAGRLHVRIETLSVDVNEQARQAGHSIERAAREARYAFFAAAAARLGATCVATAHTLDDQAETVLLRLVRGASRRGMGGIRVRRGQFIRPMLTCRRRAIRAFLGLRGDAFCEDSSNANVDVPRNRIRHELLPVFERLSPGAVPALARAAKLAAQDDLYLESQAIKAARTCVLFKSDGVQMRAGMMQALPPAIARRVIRRVLEELAPARAVSFRHVDALARLCRQTARGRHLDLAGIAVDLCGEVVRLRPVQSGRQDVAATHPGAPFEVALPVPGEVRIPGTAVHVTAARRADVSRDDLDAGAGVAIVQASAIHGALTVRNRRAGDRLRPFGAAGRRKLQDLFVDRKIPRRDRDTVPLVVDGSGRIVWVAGVVMAEECRVTAPSAGVVVLKLERRTL